jgi:hypothetical protein
MAPEPNKRKTHVWAAKENPFLGALRFFCPMVAGVNKVNEVNLVPSVAL